MSEDLSRHYYMKRQHIYLRKSKVAERQGSGMGETTAHTNHMDRLQVSKTPWYLELWSDQTSVRGVGLTHTDFAIKHERYTRCAS